MDEFQITSIIPEKKHLRTIRVENPHIELYQKLQKQNIFPFNNFDLIKNNGSFVVNRNGKDLLTYHALTDGLGEGNETYQKSQLIKKEIPYTNFKAKRNLKERTEETALAFFAGFYISFANASNTIPEIQETHLANKNSELYIGKNNIGSSFPFTTKQYYDFGNLIKPNLEKIKNVLETTNKRPSVYK